MNIRWLWFDYVPPELGLGREERRAVKKRANELRPKGMSHAANRRAGCLGMLVVAPSLAIGTVYFGGSVLGSSPLWRQSPALSICAVAILYLSTWLGLAFSRGKTHLPFVCRALRERGHDVCPDCGYLLRGLGKDITRCPECGWVREEMVAPTRECTAENAESAER